MHGLSGTSEWILEYGDWRDDQKHAVVPLCCGCLMAIDRALRPLPSNKIGAACEARRLEAMPAVGGTAVRLL